MTRNDLVSRVPDLDDAVTCTSSAAGGLGAKKVDVTWATEESGLLLAISVETIIFKDASTGNYEKNLVNRRSDKLMQAVTLHRRFPYVVLAGLFFFDSGAAKDGTGRWLSTLQTFIAA